MITQNLDIYPALNPVRTCGKYSDYKVRQECFIGFTYIPLPTNRYGNEFGNNL